MNRLLAPRLLAQCQRNVLQALTSSYCASTGSKDHIDKLVKDKKVVVFMKGTSDAPRCGFSNGVVQILNFHGIKDFDNYDVLSDENLRQGIKEYTKWPTIPQVFIGGEFVGGFDIMLDMHKNGELVEELQKVGIRSALLDKATEDAEKKSDT